MEGEEGDGRVGRREEGGGEGMEVRRQYKDEEDGKIDGEWRQKREEGGKEGRG